ncbi:MAG: glutaredoxin domain-containing protein [Candidatus Binatia bacterium]
MRNRIGVTVFLCVFGGSATVVPAEMFKWVDSNGVVHFGDTLPQDSASVGKIELLSTTKQPPLPDVREAQVKKEENIPRKPVSPREIANPEYQEASVELYATTWCGYCRKAREFFQERGVVFIEYDIEADGEAAQRKRKIDPRPGVPLVVINGKPIHGFVPQAYEHALATTR